MNQVDEQLKQLLSFKWMTDYIINYSDESVEKLFHDIFDFAYSKIDNSDYFTNENFYELLNQLSEFYYIKDIDKEKKEIIKMRLIDTYEEITSFLALNKLQENILICCFRIAGNINCFEYLYFIDNDWVNYSIKLKIEALYTIRNCARQTKNIPRIFSESPQSRNTLSIEDISNWKNLILLLKQKNGSIFKMLEPLLSPKCKVYIEKCKSDLTIDEIVKETIISDFNHIMELIKEKSSKNIVTLIEEIVEHLAKQNKKISTLQKIKHRIIFEEMFSSEFMLSKLFAKLYSEFLNYDHSDKMPETDIILLDRVLDIPGVMPISRKSFNSFVSIIKNEKYNEKLRAKLLVHLSKFYEINEKKYLEIIKSFLITPSNRKPLMMEYSLSSLSNCLQLNKSLVIDYYNSIFDSNSLLKIIENIILDSKEDNKIKEKALISISMLEPYHLFDKNDISSLNLLVSIVTGKKIYSIFSPILIFNLFKSFPRSIKRLKLASKLLPDKSKNISYLRLASLFFDNFSGIIEYVIDIRFFIFYELLTKEDLYANCKKCQFIVAYSLLKYLDNSRILGNKKIELLYSNIKSIIFSIFDISSSITFHSEDELDYAYKVLELLWKKHSEHQDEEITNHFKRMVKNLMHKYYLDKPSWRYPWGRELHIKAQEIYAEMKNNNSK